MPRAKKNTQPAQAAPGQGYGVAGDQIAAQQQIPLPQAQPVDPAMVAAQAQQMATAMPSPPPGGMLGGDSLRPSEPITAGLSAGPGPGPEVITPRVRPAAADHLMRMAEVSGDPMLQALAQRAARRRF